MAEADVRRQKWGAMEEVQLHEGPRVQHLTVNPHGRLPMRCNDYHFEHWIVLKGVGRMHLDTKDFLIDEGSSVFIPPRASHAIANLGEGELQIVAVHSGENAARPAAAAE